MKKRRVKSITTTSLVEVLNNEAITAKEISAKFAKQFREGFPNFREALFNSSIQMIIEAKIKYLAPDLYSTFGQDPASKAVFRDVAKVFSLTINWLSGTKVGGSNIVYTPINMISTIVKSAIKATMQVHLMKDIDHSDQAAKIHATFLSNISGDSISSIFTQFDRARQIDGLSNQNFITYLLKEFKSSPTRPLKTAITALSGTYLRYYPNQFLSNFIFRKGITLATQFICFAIITEAMNMFIEQEDVAPEHLTLTFQDLFKLSPDFTLTKLFANPYELVQKFSQIDYSNEIKLFAAGESHYNNIFRKDQFAVLLSVLLTKIASEMVTTVILSPPARIINNYLSATIISTFTGIIDQFYNRYDASYSLSFTTENGTKHIFDLTKFANDKTTSSQTFVTKDSEDQTHNLKLLNEKLFCSSVLSSDKNIKQQMLQIVSKLDSRIKSDTISLKRIDMLHQLKTPFTEKNNSVIFNPVSLIIAATGIASYMFLSNPSIAILSAISLSALVTNGIKNKMQQPSSTVNGHRERIQASRNLSERAFQATR